MEKSKAFDVVYHEYPSGDAGTTTDKRMAVAIAVAEAASAEPLPPAGEPCCMKGGVCGFLCRSIALLIFHVANAVLGIGGAIIVLVTFPLSIAFLSLGCAGAVLYQVLAAVVRWLAKADIALANLTNCGQKRMKVAFGIQSGFSNNIGRSGFVSRLFFVSPKSLLVMLYLSTIKLAIGCLSLIVGECVIGAPIQIAISSGGPVTFGDGFTYHNHPTAYVCAYVGLWLLGVALLFPVWWLSVKLTASFCADREEEEAAASAMEIDTPHFVEAKGADF